ncbi:MAG: class IV adenylate cyclase [Candidatus Nanoarchaeia archaeon]|nr:class IV adenylate cyclase [Candidatus Nanoarchaeia archaeon]MDD5740642.1 class IV adenylate cyclase [Candidatus Nanoarchaeia archaeon]
MVWLEVETKVKIPDSEIDCIRDKILKIAKFEKKGKKADDYFAIRRVIKGSYPKKAFRIRATKDEFEVNFKKWLLKHWTKDIVVKQEFEFKLKGKEEVGDLLALFKDLGFREWVKKIKYNETYKFNKDKRASIELNNVKHLGWFMEIEYLAQESEIDKARTKIREILKLLCIDPDWIDNTGYTKMLWYKGTKEAREFIDKK